ncbi:hypothetical protein [Sedimenticola sp.]|uniref:hypothetical protein n=1 Tax=Sedimenticola sp. TaxID=1940285 RepID=UPI003D0E1EC2
MKERVHEFPDRRSELRGGRIEDPAPERRRSRVGGLVWLIGVAVLGWLWYSGQLPLERLGYELRQWLGWEKSASPPSSSRRVQAPTLPVLPGPVPPATIPAVTAAPPVRTATRDAPVEVAAGDGIPLSISRGFRPVGFKIGVTSHPLPFTGRPGSLHRRLPPFQGPVQKYGRIDMANGISYAFVLDTDPQGYRLYVDRNRNWDLSDDGEPLVNRGKGRFAGRLRLPLARVSGIAALKGDLELWIFSTDQSWRDHSLRFYNRTQLSGDLQIKGRRYAAYLTDNLHPDGDYTNDGISIDSDGNGQIDRATEMHAPGDGVTLDGERYRFRIVR